MAARIRSSIIAGLMAGVVFGIMMQMMVAPTPDGGQMPVLAMVGQIIGSPTIAAGWIYHLFNSAVIGAIFGWLVSSRVTGYAVGLSLGALYGFAWWIVGGLILMPMFLGMAPLAPITTPGMLTVAMGSLIGHAIYGAILGGGFVWIDHATRYHASIPA